MIAARLRAYRREKRNVSLPNESEPILFGLDLPARVDSLGPLTAFALESARRRGIVPDQASLIELAIYEACLNVIEHAYGFDASRRIRIDILEEDDRLTFQIVNGGAPLDPARINARAEIDRDTRARGRGIGLHIIARVMDEVYCEKGEHGENRLVLVKHLHEAALRR
jgi:serine/threonine-protein kinase RsbW